MITRTYTLRVAAGESALALSADAARSAHVPIYRLRRHPRRQPEAGTQIVQITFRDKLDAQIFARHTIISTRRVYHNA